MSGATHPAPQRGMVRTRVLWFGIFGAPAWVWRRDGRDPLLVWGQDRLAFVEDVLLKLLPVVVPARQHRLHQAIEVGLRGGCGRQ